MSVDTSEVIDVAIRSLYCHQCSVNASLLSENTDKFKEWYLKHKINCAINHCGSSGKMETEGAIEMFLRSIPTRYLMYSTFFGDRDRQQ